MLCIEFYVMREMISYEVYNNEPRILHLSFFEERGAFFSCVAVVVVLVVYEG